MSGTGVSTGFRACRQDGQHGREGLARVVVQRQGMVDGDRDLGGQALQDALAAALAQRHGLDGGLRHASAQANANTSGHSRVLQSMSAAACAKATGQV
jgi:hypothetical protein